jgi:WD40 repeat protein
VIAPLLFPRFNPFRLAHLQVDPNRPAFPPDAAGDEGLTGPRLHSTPAKPVSIPDHELLRCIGEGSYGQVWLAKNMMGRWRAVKIVFRRSFKDDRPFNRELSGIRRFEPISRSHEGFVDVLHAGINEDEGYFYYVMEVGDDRVTGQAINPDTYTANTLSAEISRRGRLPLSECLRLAMQLSHALAELHQHGLIHRDIKPSNIIFVDGVPKLADIGLVADMDETRSFVGTEGFIPPEGPGTPQADVYSLGKVLYEASTGKDRLDFPEIPPDWSLSPEYQGLLELNEVLLRACHHDPAKRYASAWDMHADLVLVLNGKSVKKLRLLEQRWKNAKRLAGITAIVVVLAAAALYQVYREWRTVDDARRRQVADHVSYGNRAVDSGDLLGALPYFAEALRLDQGRPADEPNQRLRFSTTLAQCPKPIQVWHAETVVDSGQFSPDGRHVLLSVYYGKVEIRNLYTGQLLAAPFGPKAGLRSAAFSPNGRFVITAGENATAIIWDIQNGSEPRNLPHTNKVLSARFSPDGSRILTGCLDGFAYLWDAATGQKLFALGPYVGGVTFAGFNRDGKLIAITSYGGETGLWDAATGQALPFHFRHNTWTFHASFSPDSQRLVVASPDHKARVWDLATGKRIFPDLLHDDLVRSAEFSPDGRLILTSGYDGTARLWRSDTLQPLASNAILRHGERVTHATFDPSGRLILTTCTDGSARVWDLSTSLLPPEPDCGFLSRDATRFATLTNGTFSVFDNLNPSGRVPQSPGDRGATTLHSSLSTLQPVENAQLSSDGSAVLTISTPDASTTPAQTNRLLQIWGISTAAQIGCDIRLTNFPNSRAVALAPGSTLVAAWAGKFAQLWKLTDGTPLSPRLPHKEAITYGVFNPRGDRLALASGQTVTVWQTNHPQAHPPLTPSPAFILPAQPVPVVCIDFSADGHYLVTCSADDLLTKSYARVWDAASGRPVSPPLHHGDGIRSAAFSPDARRIVTASEDFTARVWETATGKPVGLPLKHPHQVTAAGFSPDGKWLVTACKDGAARVWDPERNTPLTPPLRHLLRLIDVRFRPDGTHLLATDELNRLFRWELAIQTRPATELVELAEFLSGTQLAMTPGAANAETNSPSLLTTWKNLLKEFPRELAPSHNNAIRWHQWQLTQSQAENDAFASQFHLRHLGQLRPNSPATQ